MKEQQEKYDLPNGWKLVRLDDVAIIVTGNTPPTNNKAYFNGDVPFYKPSDLNEDYVKDSKDRLSELGKEYSRILPKNSILITCIGSLGKSGIISKEGAFNQQINGVLPILSNTLFFYYQIISQQFQNSIRSNASATTVAILNKSKFGNLPFLIAPLDEQNLIATQIESLFSKLDEAEKVLEKANKGLRIYRQVLLNQAFSGKLTEKWRRENSIKLSAKQLIHNIEKERQTKYDLELLEWQNSLKKWKETKEGQRPSRPSKPIVPDKPTDEQIHRKWQLPKEWQWTQLGLISFVTKLAGFEYTEYVKYTEKGDLPVIKAENVGQGGFKKTIYSKVVAESVEHLKRSKLNGDELIIVFVGAGVGNVATTPQGHKFFLGPNIAIARPYKEINTKFLEYFYQSHRGKKLLLATAKAVAQPSLSMGNIRQTPVAIPSKEEQFQIIQIIENQFTLTNNLEKTVDNVLNEIIALKHSILKKAFEGRLVTYTSNESIEKLLDDIQEEKRLYLENQKELNRSKPKQKKEMEEKKTILEILKESNSPISAQELWEKSTSDGDIERFYSEIKEIYHQIDELKTKTESLLTLKDENK
ncbi:restriction endonuclease subunit S [Wandonia haliotis]|uniref:Restriction endonuclease subunit S n=1 Tax=Wandonia haliotis TaxID=574963 RepID=A0ABP3Y1G5_9FLAO